MEGNGTKDKRERVKTPDTGEKKRGEGWSRDVLKALTKLISEVAERE